MPSSTTIAQTLAAQLARLLRPGAQHAHRHARVGGLVYAPNGHGLGDDPTFINNMYNWFLTNHVAWVIYFIDDVADNNAQGINFLLTDGDFPNSLAAFEADFG